MATQDSNGIALSFCHNQQNFRLLELPPDLLDLLTSEQPPVLSLKSSPTSSASSSTPSTSGLISSHAVLTTHNQTFQIRQVQFSNSLFLLQPHLPSVPDANDLTPVPKLSMIAQCKATLELIGSPTSAVACLQELLPVYNGPHEGTVVASSSASHTTLAERRSKRDHLTDLPLSDDEFESGWREICAFESDGQALKPSAQCLVRLWKAVVSACTEYGIFLDGVFITTDLLSGVLEADDYPESLVKAVLQNLGSPVYWSALRMRVNEEKCIRWVGVTMLEAMGKQSTPISDFQEAWRNELPERWRTAATLDALKGVYSQPTSTTIQFNNYTSDSTLGKASSAGTTGGSGKNSRKWHERFKATR